MAKKYKCMYCEKRLIRKDLINHIYKYHKELIPENYTAARLVYNQVNKVEYGKCRVCGKETQWSEKSGRYDVLCGNPKCKEHMREEYKKNMLRVKGTYNILNDPEQQKKMLANRSISGQYKFQDGGVLIYTGSYEKKCLEFMDIVMQIPSKDILSPGPTLEYEYNGQKHFYIADFYYIPYNLIIEVKDGGSNLNTKDSASMRASREKTIEKERIITDKGEYNYIRLTNNNFVQLIEVFMDIKDKLLRGDDSKTYKINESQVVLEDYFNEVYPFFDKDVQDRQSYYLWNGDKDHSYADEWYGVCFKNNPYSISFDIPDWALNYIPEIEKVVGNYATKEYKKFYSNPANRPSPYCPFKSYESFKSYGATSAKDRLNNLIYDDTRGIERWYAKAYQYNFPIKISNTRTLRCSVLIITVKDSIRSIYVYDKYDKLTKMNIRFKVNESQIILEDYFVDKKDIYYNKDKFDSGEINLCFITGLSGSGKTTMGKTMQFGNIEVYELDDIISNWNFSDANLKEYGSLVYSFFKGPGKMYRYTSYDEWMNDSKWDNPTNPYANSYDAMIIKDFIKYAKLYANSHKNIKFILEGVWVFYFIDPKELDSYAVYIKGTSVLISFIRSAKRDCQDANSNMEKFGSFIKMVTSIGRMKGYLSNEKRLLQFYEYFASKVINESQIIAEDYFVESSNQLYHISNRKGITNINPSIPNNFMTKNGYEENKTKRVCFAPSVDQCLMALSRNCEGEEFYVYTPDGDYKTYTPSIKEVPDVKITGEIWIKESVNVKCIGKIRVLDTNNSPGKSYSYGNNQTAELYAFDYKWIENINESLEDISGVVFGKRKLIQDKYITLYHGTSIKDLPWISPLSGNVGLKNAKPKMSSFWFNNLDYAITFSTMDYIARNLNDKDACKSMVLDNDMKVMIDNKYKSKVITSIKNGESYVYERTVESKYVGYGHNGVFPEYTLDIPVKPDRYYVIKFEDMINKIKFVSENYIKSIKQKYADGKMDFGANKMQVLMDRVFYYSGHNDRVDKIKQAKAYSKISFNDILDLNKMLNQYEYIIPNNGDIITQISEDSFNKYKLLSPDEFKKYKGGICWDYVVYEAYWFDKYFTNIPYSVYFEVLDNKIDCPTHTFLIFEYGGKYYWFESSWKPMCGVYGGFDTEKDAVDYVMSKLNDSKSNYKNYICKYDPLDSKMFGMNSKQFMNYLLPKVKLYKFPNKVVIPTTVIKGITPEHKSY